MPGSLLNYRFRGTTLPYEELLIALKNIILDKVMVFDEKNPNIRNNRDGTVIKLDANNGVYTTDMWVCLDEIGPVFSWQGQ